MITGPASVAAKSYRESSTRGDRKAPIALVRSERVPDATTGFDQELSAYFQGMARLRLSRKPVAEGVGAGSAVVHYFRIDYAGLSVENRDYVILGKVMLRILSVKPIYHGAVIRELDLEAIEVNVLDGPSGAAVVVKNDPVSNPDSSANQTNPFWTSNT